MFISQLRDKIQAFDKYGEHRLNGFKALYFLELLLLFELFSSITHPYFYYFFIACNCFVAEVIGTTIKQKFILVFWIFVGSAITVFLFGVFSSYHTFFVFFIFFYSSLLYFIVFKKPSQMLAIIPVILGMGAYSLTYIGDDVNFYIALNHALITLVAGCVVLAAMYLFPNRYYLGVWKRAFFEVVEHLEAFCLKIYQGQAQSVEIFPGIVVMQRYCRMLPRMTKNYSILKITLLTFDMVLAMSYLVHFGKQGRVEYTKVLHLYLGKLALACKDQKKVILQPQELMLFQETHELQLLYKLITSWNYVCTNI